MPRNGLHGLPLHRFDLRVSHQVPISGHVKASLIAEIFNLFNHANYGNYNTTVNFTTFGQPRAIAGNA